MKILSIIYWLTIIFYALSFGIGIYSLVFKKDLISKSIFITAVGFVLHTSFITARWLSTGFPPFVSYFESMSASAWFGVFAYFVSQKFSPYVKNSIVLVMLLVFLLMGWSATKPIGGDILPVSLQSFWLFIHASFATASVGCFIIAASVGVIRLYKSGAKYSENINNEFSTLQKYDEFNFRIILLGFLFYGVMIISGSIWADLAWGRYWGWDPIELWSLITWLLYALYLHIYVTWKKLRGKFLAYYSIIALLFAAFSLWGVGIVYKTLHTYGG